MSHLEQSLLNSQKFFNTSRSNSHILGNPEVSIDYRPLQFQIRNDLAQIGSSNNKLKEDYAINKAKLMGARTNIVQQKRMSSMDNIQIVSQWAGKQRNLPQNNGLQFRKNVQHVVNNFIPPQQVTVPQPNQQNRGDFTNITQVTTKISTQVESLTIQIRQYLQQITQLQKSEQTYKKEVSTYKEMVNKVQSILHEKESALIGERTQILKQKEVISELERQLLQLKGNQDTEKVGNVADKCVNCEQMTKKIAKLTKQITQLTNQLNAKTERVKQMEGAQKGSRQIQFKNKQLQAQITKITLEFEKTTSQYQSQIFSLRQELSAKFSHSQAQRQMSLLREQNIQLRSELEETEKATQERFGELMNENEQLNNQVQELRRIVQERQDSSHISSSQQSTVLVEYERSIQTLQEEIHSLRRELNQKQSGTSTNQIVNELQQRIHQYEEQNNQIRVDNNEQFERIQERDAEIAKLNKELVTVGENYQRVRDQSHGLRQEVKILTGNLETSSQQVHILSLKIKELSRPQSQKFTKKSESDYMKQIGEVRHQLQCSKKMIAQLFAKIEQNNQEDTRTEQELQNRYKQSLHRYSHQIQTLTSQLKQKETITHEMQRQMHTMRERMFGFEQECNRLGSELVQSNEKYEEAYSGLVRAENYIEEQEKRVFELENQLNILSVPQGNQEHFIIQINNKLTIITQLQEELTKLHSQSAFSSSEINRLNSVIVQTNKSKDQLVKENHGLRDELTSARNQLTILRNQLTSARNQSTNARNQLLSMRSSFSSVQNDLHTARNQLTSTKNQLSQLQNEFTSVKNQNSQSSSAQNELSSVRNQLLSLQDQLSSALKQLQLNKNNLYSTQTQLSSTQTRLLQTQNKLFTTQNQLSSVETLLSSVQNEFSTLKSQLIPSVDPTELQNLKQQILTLQQEKSVSISQARSIHQKLVEAENFIMTISLQIEQKNHQIQQNIQEIEQKDHLINQLRTSLDKSDNSSRLEKENAQLRQRISQLDDQINKLKVQFTKKQGQLTQIKNSYENQLSTLKQQIFSQSSEINQLRSTISTKERDLAQLHTIQLEKNTIQQQLTSQSTELIHLHNIISTKQSQLFQLRETKDELSRYISVEQSKQLQNQQSLSQTTQLTVQLKNYEKLIEELQNQKNSLHQHLENAQNYIFEFEQKNYAQIVDQLHIVIGGLEDQMNKLLSRQKELEYLLHEKHQQEERGNAAKTQQYEQKINAYITEITVLKQRITFIESELTRLNEINIELQHKIASLTQQNARFRNLEQTLQTRHAEDLEQMRLRIRQLETQRESFLQNVDNMKNKLLAEQPQTIIQLDQSRVKVDKFIEENHRIIENLRRAENHIQEMEIRCEEYLAEIQRLKSGLNVNVSMRESRKTIRNVLDDESQFDRTPIRKIDSSSFDQSSGFIIREDETLLLRIGQLEETILAMRKEIESRGSHIKNLEGQVSSLERERETLQQNVVRLSQVASTHQVTIREVAAFDTQKKEFERLIVRLENEKLILKSENQRLNQTVESKSSQLFVVENKWQEIRHNMQEIERRNASLVEEIRTISIKPQQSQTSLQEIQNLRLAISGLESQIHNIEREKATLIQKNQEQQVILSSKSQQAEGYAIEINHLKGVITQIEGHLHEVERHNGSLAHELQVLSSRPQQNEAHLIEIQQLRNVIGTLEVHIHELREQNGSLANQVQVISTKSQQDDTHLSEIHHLEGRISELERIIGELERENIRLRDEITNKQHQNNIFKAETQNLQTQLLQLQGRLLNLQQENGFLINQIQTLTKQSEKLSTQSQQNDEQEKEIKQLKAVKFQLESLNSKNNDEMIRLAIENGTLTEDLKVARQAIRSLQITNYNLTGSIEQLENKSRSLEQTISSTVVITPSNHLQQLDILRAQLERKDLEIQEVIKHLNNAEEFIAENEAVFVKAEQEKTEATAKMVEIKEKMGEMAVKMDQMAVKMDQMTVKMGEMENNIVELNTVNLNLKKQLESKNESVLISINLEKEKSQLEHKLTELQQNITLLTASNNNLQKQLNSATQHQSTTKLEPQQPHQQQELSDQQVLQHKLLKQQHQSMVAQIQQWQEEVSNLNGQIAMLRRVQLQHHSLLNVVERMKTDYQVVSDQLARVNAERGSGNVVAEQLNLQISNERVNHQQVIERLQADHQQIVRKLQADYQQTAEKLQIIHKVQTQKLLNNHKSFIENLQNTHQTEVNKLHISHISQIENLHNNHRVEVQRLHLDHKKQVQRINDENKFLQDSISQLNSLIQKDRKTINQLKDQVSTLNQRHTNQVILLRNELQQTITSQQDADYIRQLEGHIKQIEQNKNEVYNKLKEAEAYIVYIEQEKQVLLENTPAKTTDGVNQITEEQHNQVTEKLVHAESVIMQLETELNTLAAIVDTLNIQKLQLVQINESLQKAKLDSENQKSILFNEKETLLRENQTLSNEKQTLQGENQTLLSEKQIVANEKEALQKERSQLFIIHDQKLAEMNQRNFRIQEELQQTVIRVSEEHMQLVSILQKVDAEKRTLESQLSLMKQLESNTQNAKETNTRVLEQMRATITRISQDNKILLSENREVDGLRDQVNRLNKLLSEKTNQTVGEIEDVQRLLKEKTQQVQEFEKALEVETRQVYQLSTELNQVQHLISLKSQQLVEKDSQLAYNTQNITKLTQANLELSRQIETLRAQLLSLASTKQTVQPTNNYQKKMSDSLNEITLSLKQKSQLINSLEASLRNQRNKSVEVEKGRVFFEAKLLEAEQYIQQTQKDRRQLAQKYHELHNELERLKLNRIDRIQQRSNEEADIQANSSIANISAIMENDDKYKELKETIEHQEATINDLTSTMYELQVQIDSKEHQLNEKRKEISELNHFLKQLQKEKETTALNIAQLNERVALEANNAIELQKIIQNLEKELKDERQVKEQLTSALQQESTTVSNQFQQTNKVISTLQSDLSEKDKQISRLKDTIAQLQDQKLAIQSSGREAFSRELDVHKKLNEELIRANKQTKNELNLLREKALEGTEAKHHLHELENKLKEKEVIEVQFKETEHKLTDLVNKLIEAERQIEKLTYEKQNIQKELNQQKEQSSQDKEQLTKQRDQLTKERDQLSKERDQLSKERDQFANDNDLLIRQKDLSASEIKQLLNQKDLLIQQKDLLVADKTQLVRQNHLLTQEKDQLVNQKALSVAEKEDLIKEKEEQLVKEKYQLTADKEKLVQQKEQLVGQLQSIKHQLDTNKSLFEQTTQVLEAKKGEIEKVQKQLESTKQLSDQQIINKNNQIQQLINELNQSMTQLSSVTDELNHTKKQLSEVAPQLSSAVDRVTNLEKQLKEVKSQNDHLVEQLVEAESQVTNYEQNSKKLQQLKISEEQKLNIQINGLNDRLNNLTQERDSLSSQLITFTHKLNDLQTTITQRDTTITQLNQVIDAGKQTANIKSIFEQQIIENTKRIEELLSQINSANQQNHLLNKLLDEFKTKVTQLNDQITQLKTENSQFMSLHEHLMDEISEEQIKVQKKDEELNGLKKLIEVNQTEKINLEKDISAQKINLQNNVTTLKDKLSSAETTIKQLQQQLSHHTETLKQSFQQNSDLLSSRQLEISNLSGDLKQITQKLNQKQEQLLVSQTELLSIKNKITEMQQRIEEEERVKLLMKQQLQDSLENSHELTLMNDRLNEADRDILAEKVKSRDLELRNNELIQSVVELEAENNSLVNNVNDLQQRNQNLLDSLQKLSSQFNNLETENATLKDQLKQLQLRLQNLIEEYTTTKPLTQQQLDEVDELKLKLLEKQQELQPLRDQNVDLNIKLGNFQIDIQNLNQRINNYEIDIENYKKIIEENAKENNLGDDLERLKDNLKNADDYITNLDQKFNSLNQKNSKLENTVNSLKIQLNNANDLVAQLKNTNNQDQTTIAQLQSTIIQLQSQPRSSSQTKIEDPSSTQKITKIVQKLTKYVEQNDSLDIYLEQNIERDLTSNPIFKTLYETIKYKLRLLNAIDKEKTVNLFEKQKLAEELAKTIRKLEQQRKEMHEKVSQAEILQTSYHQVLAKLIEMERHNKSLENQVNQLNNQLSLHKSQIEEFQSKLQNESSSLSAEGDKTDSNNIISGGDLFIDEKLKEQNLSLRKELEEALYEIHRLKNNTSNFNSFHNSPVISPLMNKRVMENNEYFKEFLRECLMTIGGLEDSVNVIEKDLMGNRQSIERLFTSKTQEKHALGSKGSEDSWMLEKIQQLEEKLLENQQRLRQHKNQTEVELINMVRETLINPLTSEANILNTPQFDREKVEAYLRDLQDIILKKDLAHDEQINRLKSISQRHHNRNESSVSPHKEFENEQEFDRDYLLKEIAGLNKHIQLYHAQSDRRKAQYKRTIEDLLQQIQLLKKQYDTVEPSSTDKKPFTSLIDNLKTKTKNLLEQQSLQDFDDKSDYLNDDDFIVSNNYVQWISKKGANEQSPNKEQQHFVHDLKSIAEEFQNKESSIPSRNNLSNVDNNQNPTSVENKILNLSNNVSKEELLSRPILEFIVQNKDFDQTEINMLKKKINEIQSRNNQEKMKILKEHEQKISEFLAKNNLLKQNESKDTQTEGALNALCNNLTRQQIEKLVSSTPEQVAQEMIIKIQEVVSNSSLEGSSFLRSESNSYEMMQTILETKNKYYPEPTPLSEEMFHHLIKILSSKDNQEFYALIDSLFSYLSMLENDFLNTLKQKEEMYQKHTEKMNQVLGLNESSDQDLDLEDEEYYKKILLLTKDEQAEIERIRKEETQKGIEEQLEQELRKAADEQGQQQQEQEGFMRTI